MTDASSGIPAVDNDVTSLLTISPKKLRRAFANGDFNESMFEDPQVQSAFSAIFLLFKDGESQKVLKQVSDEYQKVLDKARSKSKEALPDLVGDQSLLDEAWELANRKPKFQQERDRRYNDVFRVLGKPAWEVQKSGIMPHRRLMFCNEYDEITFEATVDLKTMLFLSHRICQEANNDLTIYNSVISESMHKIDFTKIYGQTIQNHIREIEKNLAEMKQELEKLGFDVDEGASD